MDDSKHTAPEVFVDDGLFDEAARGNCEAVRVLAENAARALTPRHGRDDLTRWLIDCLGRVAAGEEPNRAFGWTIDNRPPINRELLHWTLARYVSDLRACGHSRKDALDKVGRAANMDGRKGGALEAIYDRFKGAAFEDLAWPPLPTDYSETTARIETRLSSILASEPPKPK